jgi:hypothetical protein
MAKQQKGKSGGMRKIGRNLEKCKMYRAMHKREMNKVRRVLRSSGRVAAEKYARENNVSAYLAERIK